MFFLKCSHYLFEIAFRCVLFVCNVSDILSRKMVIHIRFSKQTHMYIYNEEICSTATAYPTLNVSFLIKFYNSKSIFSK